MVEEDQHHMMDPEEEQAYMQQMQMQQQQEMYQDEYGQEVLMNQMGQPYVEQTDASNALTLAKVYGFNKDIDQGVHFLADDERTEIFYSAAHTGVIYNYITKKQKLLQGHCNQITSILCSDDKNWVVTADSGDDSMLVVWQSNTGTPVRTFLKPHPGGIKQMDLSADNRYIATLGADDPQTCSLWDWTDKDKDGPQVSMKFDYSSISAAHWIKFNPMDPHELACNGTSRVLFMKWTYQSETFQYYGASVGKDNSAGKDETYTKTIFLPGTEKAVTGTANGEILVWEVSKIKTGIGQIGEKKLEKVVQLNIDNQAINILLTVGNYLVCGNADGTIRFYDVFFKAEAWFEDQQLSSVKSISFSQKKETVAAADSNLDQEKADASRFKCSDFLVADSNGMVAQLKATMYEAIDSKSKRGDTIMMGLKSAISAIAVHPNRPYIAVAQDDGWIGIYDYDQDFNLVIFDDITKKDKKSNDKSIVPDKVPKMGDAKDGKPPRKRLITCMEFTPEGELLIALSKGKIEVMSVEDKLMDEYPGGDLSVTDGPRLDVIKQLIVSADGKYFATSDSNNCVSLFKKDHQYGDPDSELCWQFNGKIMSHTVEISSICFSNSLDENDTLRLFSIGKDRRCFEYNVATACQNPGLMVEHMFPLEKEAFPTACIWYPSALDSKEGLLLTANNEYKMKLWNPTTKTSRRTCLGPTYGGEIQKLKLLEEHGRDGKQYLLYSTAKKVIGLIQLPLDGNPHKTMGLIAHPDEVQDICASSDGKYVFTCGGNDLAVNMWQVDVTPIEQAIAMGGEDIEPFIQLIEGGAEGQTYQDINDFFYYSMIRSKKENTTKTRKLEGRVPVDQLPYLMRAMGYYPTMQEIINMQNEVRFSSYTQRGEPNLHVDLNTFIKLFVNHRPVYGIGKNNIDEAFKAILQDSDGDVGQDAIIKDELLGLLSGEGDGEEIQMRELEQIMVKLVSNSQVDKALGEHITSERFAEEILGFEEVDENEGEEEEEAQAAGAGNTMGNMSNMDQSKLGVIQEEP